MRLWPALDAIPSLAAVVQTWRSHLSDEWPLVQPLLVPRHTLAASIDDGSGEVRAVREHGPDDFVTVCVRTGDVRTTSRAEIVVHALAERLLCRELARALDVEGTPRLRSPACASWLLGTIASATGRPSDVIWIGRASPQHVAAEAADICAGATSPPLVITPTRTSRSARLDLLVGRGACEWHVASELLDWDGPGRFVARQPLSGERDTDDDPAAGPVIELPGGLVLDAARSAVTLAGKTVLFDGKKGDRFSLLRILATNRGRPVSHARLRAVDAPWHKTSLNDRTLTMAVRRLKEQLIGSLPTLASAISTRRVDTELRPVLNWPPSSVPEV